MDNYFKFENEVEKAEMKKNKIYYKGFKIIIIIKFSAMKKSVQSFTEKIFFPK